MQVIDISTLQFLSASIIIVLTSLLILLWFRNQKQIANTWWCLFSIALSIDATISFFPEIRNFPNWVYVFNSIATFSYFSLLMGLLEFSGTKMNKKWVFSLFISCLLLNIIGATVVYSDEIRRGIIVGYNSIFLILAVYVVMKLDGNLYFLEKMFMQFLLFVHLALHLYWLYLDFKISEPNETFIINAATPIYIILILVTITILLLILGKMKHDLEEENKKSIIIKNALSAALKETNVANKSKSVFLTNMSHELRTPLNIILGFSEAMKLERTGPLNEKQMGIIKNIHFGGKRLLNLINDLLNLSNIETGDFDKGLKKIKLDDLLGPHLAIIEDIAKQHNISLHVINDLEDVEGLVFVLGRQDWFEQILIALVDNAAKYGNKNGNIWINIFQHDHNTIRISVKDEGHGIASDEIGNVFKPFNRAGIDSRAIEGTGAGLSIAKGLVDAMNCSIDFDSSHGIGTTFWVDIPLQRA